MKFNEVKAIVSKYTRNCIDPNYTFHHGIVTEDGVYHAFVVDERKRIKDDKKLSLKEIILNMSDDWYAGVIHTSNLQDIENFLNKYLIKK